MEHVFGTFDFSAVVNTVTMRNHKFKIDVTPLNAQVLLNMTLLIFLTI